jgi:hypothetical protein
MKLVRVACLLFLVFFARYPMFAQNGQRFTKEDITFYYPENWHVSDRSSAMVNQLNLAPNMGNVLIIISVYRPKLTQDDEFYSLRNFIAKPLVGNIAKDFDKLVETGSCVHFMDKTIPGQRSTGILANEQSTVSSFSVVINNKFVNLIYLKQDKESSIGDPAWEMLLKTFQLRGTDNKTAQVLLDLQSDAVKNEKGEIARPTYPSSAGILYVDTVIKVRVTIDEKGKVVLAEPISGQINLRPAAIVAAKASKFAPTYICGEPTKVTTVINFIFEAR